MKQRIINIYKKVPSWLKNRYFISAVLFLIWMLFFDANSIQVQIEQKKEIQKTKNDIEYYKRKIVKDKQIINILSQDSLTPELEKYFRENLFLSEKNEEIFIIE